jgi:glycosyltransferase involved in cell wall biosynthesis
LERAIESNLRGAQEASVAVVKILFLSHARNDRNAGASRVVHTLHDGLTAKKHAIRTLHYEDFAPLHIGVMQRLVDKLLLPQFISYRAGGEAASGYDVILASNGCAYPLFRRLQRHAERPMLVSMLHGLNLFDRQADVVERLAGRQYLSLTYRTVTGPITSNWDALGTRFSDLTIVQNDRDYDFLLRGGVPAAQLARIAPGIYPEIMAASEVAPAARDRDPAALLWFGSWTARKGMYSLSTAFELILQKAPQATLTIGGTGLPEAEILSSFSAGAAQRVRVLPRISLEQQLAEFGRHAIFLFPSLSEGYGLALVEAMALGLAAVTTNTGVGGDVLCHGENALIVPQGSAVHLARAVVTLIGDDTLRTTLASKGQKLARTLSVDGMVDGYEATLSSGILRRAAGQRTAA